MDVLRDLWGFLRTRKKFWVPPLIILMLLVGLVIFFSQAASFSFIYTVF